MTVRTVKDLHLQGQTEDWAGRVVRMLDPLEDLVHACGLCHLGRKMCTDHQTVFAPQVFSNMRPSRWMVVGQNPGFNETQQGEPFVGDAGKNFNEQLTENGLSRDYFYVTSSVKCYTVGNARPDFEYIKACEPFLRMEIKLLKPVLVILLGSVAFDVFCPELRFSDCLGSIIRSQKFEVDVYPIYHPSPRNLSLPERRIKFEEDIGNLCALMSVWFEKNPQFAPVAQLARAAASKAVCVGSTPTGGIERTI